MTTRRPSIASWDSPPGVDLASLAAWLDLPGDRFGAGRGGKQAATEIAAIEVAAPRAASYVPERAIQTFGATGVSGDTPLAEMWAGVRTLHLADGPDEVHLRSVARVEINRVRNAAAGR